MILTSKNNPLIRETAALKEKKYRKELGLFLVEGRKMAMECAGSDFQIERIFISENYSGEIPDGAEVVTVSDGVLRYLSDEVSPQGIICRVKIPRSPRNTDFAGEKIPADTFPPAAFPFSLGFHECIGGKFHETGC